MIFRTPLLVRCIILISDIMLVRDIFSAQGMSKEIWLSIISVILFTLFAMMTVKINKYGIEYGLSFPWSNHIQLRFYGFMPWERVVVWTYWHGPFFTFGASINAGGIGFFNLLMVSKYRRAIGLILHYSREKAKWRYDVEKIINKYPVREGDIET